jgi:hypothetical protein
MSLCGISKALGDLEAQATNIKNLISSQLNDATEGIAASIASLEGAVSAQIGAFKSSLEGLIPDIPLPIVSLQQDFIKISTALKTNLAIRSPAAFAALIASVKGKYIDIDIDIDGYIEQMTADLTNFDPCKAIPNIQIIDGVTILKGNPITVPLKDATALVDMAINKSSESISKALEQSSKADENITNAMINLSSNVSDSFNIPEKLKIKPISEL